MTRHPALSTPASSSTYRAAPPGDLRGGVVSPAQLPIEPITVRIKVAMRITGIGRSKLYALIKSGDIETVKIGSLTLVKMHSLRRLVRVPHDERS